MTWTMRVLAAVLLIVVALHAALGTGADALLGAGEWATRDPVLDSQSRFFGVSLGLYALLLWRCAADPTAHRALLRDALLVFWLAGLARLVSVWMVGWPPAPVLALTALELLLPPALWWALQRVR